MLSLLKELHASAADAAVTIAGHAADGAVVLWGAFATMPLPVGLTAIAAGLALGNAIAQRADRRH